MCIVGAMLARTSLMPAEDNSLVRRTHAELQVAPSGPAARVSRYGSPKGFITTYKQVNHLSPRIRLSASPLRCAARPHLLRHAVLPMLVAPAVDVGRARPRRGEGRLEHGAAKGDAVHLHSATGPGEPCLTTLAAMNRSNCQFCASTYSKWAVKHLLARFISTPPPPRLHSPMPPCT